MGILDPVREIFVRAITQYPRYLLPSTWQFPAPLLQFRLHVLKIIFGSNTSQLGKISRSVILKDWLAQPSIVHVEVCCLLAAWVSASLMTSVTFLQNW